MTPFGFQLARCLCRHKLCAGTHQQLDQSVVVIVMVMGRKTFAKSSTLAQIRAVGGHKKVLTAWAAANYLAIKLAVLLGISYAYFMHFAMLENCFRFNVDNNKIYMHLHTYKNENIQALSIEIVLEHVLSRLAAFAPLAYCFEYPLCVFWCLGICNSWDSPLLISLLAHAYAERTLGRWLRQGFRFGQTLECLSLLIAAVGEI